MLRGAIEREQEDEVMLGFAFRKIAPVANGTFVFSLAPVRGMGRDWGLPVGLLCVVGCRSYMIEGFAMCH